MQNVNKPKENFAADLQFAVSESYKTIRTNLQFLLTKNQGCKVIAVSSAQA